MELPIYLKFATSTHDRELFSSTQKALAQTTQAAALAVPISVSFDATTSASSDILDFPAFDIASLSSGSSGSKRQRGGGGDDALIKRKKHRKLDAAAPPPPVVLSWSMFKQVGNKLFGHFKHSDHGPKASGDDDGDGDNEGETDRNEGNDVMEQETPNDSSRPAGRPAKMVRFPSMLEQTIDLTATSSILTVDTSLTTPATSTASTRTGSILKSKTNNNLREEKARIAKSDSVGVNDFVSNLAKRQMLRRQMGNYFEDARQYQIQAYYYY